MKKRPLDIAILVCLIIVHYFTCFITLAVDKNNKSTNRTNSKKDMGTSEVVEKEEKKRKKIRQQILVKNLIRHYLRILVKLVMRMKLSLMFKRWNKKWIV